MRDLVVVLREFDCSVRAECFVRVLGRAIGDGEMERFTNGTAVRIIDGACFSDD